MNGVWSSGDYLGSGNSNFPDGGAHGNLAYRTSYYDSHRVYQHVLPPRKSLEKNFPPPTRKKRPSTLTDFGTQNNYSQQKIKSYDPDPPSTHYKGNTPDKMEAKIELSELRGKKIWDLRETLETNLSFENISVEDMADWIIKNPDDNKQIPYEYNPLAERFIIKLMPHAVHDSLQSFFTQTAFGSFVEKVGLSAAHRLIKVGSGTSFENFKGKWSESQKLSDAFLMLAGMQFPVVVCEAGWSESHKHLLDDARLWLLHTKGQTKVVIVLSFTESNARESTRELVTTNEEETLEPDRQEAILQTNCEEQLVIQSIDATTEKDDLAQRLLDLDRQTKLQKPLVRDLTATLYVYRASTDLKDVVESFNATILPPPADDFTGPRQFQISFQDIFGSPIPEGLDPQDHIIFNLPVLEAIIMDSIPNTTQLRARQRAEKLLKEAGVWKGKDTFAQNKRRRRG